MATWTVKVPAEHDTTFESRIEFLEMTRETLVRVHNENGRKVANGEMTLPDFRAWQRDWYRPRDHGAAVALADARHEKRIFAAAKTDQELSAVVDLDRDIVPDGSVIESP